MNTQDAIRIAEIETTETRNRRGWTTEEVNAMHTTPTRPTVPTPEALATLRALTTPEQFAVITAAARGEEAEHFIAIIGRLRDTWQAMPKTYESTAKGRAALAHLHYFIGGCDWWIVEKDADTDHAGQVQAFGIADLGMGAEIGYISIPELLENGAELDLYYTTLKTIGELLD